MPALSILNQTRDHYSHKARTLLQACAEYYFTRGTGGSAPRNFLSIFLYLEHQVQKKTILPYLPVFTIIIIIIILHHHRHRSRRLALLVIPLLCLPIFYQFFFIQHFRHSRPMRSS